MKKVDIVLANKAKLHEMVATEVMDWQKRHSPDPTIWAWELPDGTRVTEEAWKRGWRGNWLDNLNHTWEVVDRMQFLGYQISIADREEGAFTVWSVDFYEMVDDAQVAKVTSANGHTVAFAICRAALLTVVEDK